VGKPIQLPELKQPTNEEINYWHNRYIEELLAIYERHKHLNKNLPIELY